MVKNAWTLPRAVSLAIAFGGVWMSGAGCGGGGTKLLTKAELMDPTTCKECHQTQYTDWSRSMHAYASEDPVFRAMNRRGQDETGGALGAFCVKCHAPVAVAEGLTTDGLNLDTVAASAKGVTCFFCHSAASIDTTHNDNGTHNNPLTLTTDGTLFGPFADPAAGTPHKSTYGTLFDLARPESAQACGSCHDIVNTHGAAIERTYSEWKDSLFVDLKTGQTCVRCHMNQTEGTASSKSTKNRSLGSHLLPGVDVALTPFPADDPQAKSVQMQSAQSLLDSVLQGTLCVNTAGDKIEVSLDNVNAGHFWPSGATPDRRAWLEITASAGGAVIYQSGNVPAGSGQSVETIADPDLWLMRDCLFDESKSPVHMFWDAFTVSPPNQIPGPVKPTVTDPTSFYKAHVKYVYPVAAPLPMQPDRVTMRVHLKAIGDDVLRDLVETKDASGNGYLAADMAAAVPEFVLGGAATIEWTPQTATAPIDIQTRTPDLTLRCVQTASQYRTLPDVAVSHARCEFGQP